ncbi:MAG: hypothetical protein KDA88_01950 [Planctomycetaceae bacterium]|nr:hypothetical protein [Planctomycetaceae bacterium]
MNKGTEIFDSRKVRPVTPLTSCPREQIVPPSHGFLVDSADAPYDYYGTRRKAD